MGRLWTYAIVLAVAIATATSAAEAAGKKIAVGKPRYRAKKHAAWKDKGRIVGPIRQCPGCEIKALDAKTKKVVKSVTVKPGGKGYELEWLEPGKYILLVTAEGCEALDVHDLVVKAGHDLRLVLEF